MKEFRVSAGYRILLLLLGFTLTGFCPQGNDIIVIRHEYYTSYFSITEHIPLMVHYTLRANMTMCDAENRVPRSKARFAKDPDYPEETNLAKDYLHSGYDRGHNMSAADNACDAAGMKECFYFSNMTPQPHFFNAGVWEDLEKKERREAIDYDSIIVTTGSIGKAGAIGEDSVVVPEYMWKVIYIPAEQRYESYLFPNANDDSRVIDDYTTTLKEIEKRAEVKFDEGKVEL